MENSLVIRYDELESSQAVLKNFNEEFEASLTKLQKLVGAKSDIARLSKDHNDMVSKEIGTYHDEIDSIAETQEMANTMEDLCGSAVYQFSDFEQSTEDQAKAFFDQLGIEGEVAEPHVYKNFNEYYGSPEYEHRGYGTEAPYAPNPENVDLTNKILSDNGIQEKLDATNADTTGSCQTQTPTTTSDETEDTGAKTKKGNFWTKVEAFLSFGLTEEDRQRLQNQKTWGNPDGPPSKQEPEEETPAQEPPAQEPPAEETPEPTTPADGGGHDRNKNKGGKNKNNKNENKLEKLSEETETAEAEFDGTEELGIEDKIGDKLTEEIDGTEPIDEITDGIDTVENPDKTTKQDHGNGENLTDGTENTGDQPPETEQQPTEQPVTETPEEVPQEKPAEEPVTENPPVQTPVEEQPQEEKPVEVQQPTEQPQPEPTPVAEPEPTPVVEEPEPTVEEAPPVPEVNNNVDETVSETPAEEPLPELTNVDPNLEDPDANGKPETPEQPGEEINPGTGENPGNENPGTGETPGAEENPGGNEVNTPVVEQPQPETKPDTDNSNSIIDNPAAAIPAAGGAVTAGTTAVAGKAIVDHQAANATAQTTSEGLKLESLNDNATIDNNHNESYNSSSVEPDLIKEEMESTNTEMNNLSSDNHSSNNHSTTTESSNESDESDLAGIAKEYLEDEEEGKGENFSASDVTRIE